MLTALPRLTSRCHPPFHLRYAPTASFPIATAWVWSSIGTGVLKVWRQACTLWDKASLAGGHGADEDDYALAGPSPSTPELEEE